MVHSFSFGALEGFSFADDGHAIHVRYEDIRDADGAVRLLIVFHDSSDSTADSEAGAIQRMDEFRFCTRGSTEADIRATCLKSRQFEQEEISLYLFCAGIQTSIS